MKPPPLGLTSAALVLIVVPFLALRAAAELERPDTDDALAGFICSNHNPSHYAHSAEQTGPLSEKYGCTGWMSVNTGNIRGQVLGPTGPMGGVQISVLTNDRFVLAQVISGPGGTFILPDVPLKGIYTLRAEAVGHTAVEREVDAAAAAMEGIRISLGGAGGE